MKRFIPLLCLGATLAFPFAHAKSNPASRDYLATRDYYQKLIAGTPQLAELQLFTTMLPKGGDLHHHYTGAIYAETYLDWVGRQNLCVYRATLRIGEQASSEPGKECLSADAVRSDDALYRQVLMRWSDKDFYNHSHDQPPPDKQFFDTFGYFGPAAGYSPREGLMQLKQRAKAENMQYLETMLRGAPATSPSLATELDTLPADAGPAAIDALLAKIAAAFDADSATQQAVAGYRSELAGYAQGLDDADFAVRFQTYVSRNSKPSVVFAGLYSAFAAAKDNKLLVGVNIVGPENGVVAMRDYALHMRMFHVLKQRFPATHLAMHAGELALGMVPPEGLQSHIAQAVEVAGAERIGHGIDVTHEAHADQLMDEMRRRDVAVEINLSSNAFILGVMGEAHPVTVYMRHHVPILISTDDAGVSRSNLSGEYLQFASRYKPSYDVLKQTVYNSIRYAFLSADDKARQKAMLDERFARFEAAVAAMTHK